MAGSPAPEVDEPQVPERSSFKRSTAPRSALLRHLDEVNSELEQLQKQRNSGPLSAPEDIAKCRELGRTLDAYKRSPLHMAAASADVGLLRKLLHQPEYASLVGTRDEIGLTPCHHAAAVGRQVTLHLRSRETTLDPHTKQELLNELVSFLGGLLDEGSDAHDALIASRDAATRAVALATTARIEVDSETWSGIEAPLWLELPEEEEAGLTPGVWVDVQARLLPTPAVAERRPPPPAEPPVVAGVAATPLPMKSTRTSTAGLAPTAPPAPPEPPSMASTSLAGTTALELAETAAEKVPMLEILLRHEGDATGAVRLREAPGRLVVGARLSEAVAALRYVLEEPPVNVGNERVPPELWNGALADVAAPPRLALHGIRIINSSASAIALGPRALWVQAELLGDEPSMARALLRRPLASTARPPSPKQRRKRSSTAEAPPHSSPMGSAPLDVPAVELTLPANNLPALDSLTVRLSLWTEDGNAMNSGTEPRSIRQQGEFPKGWREIGGVRMPIRALQSAYGGFGRLVLSAGGDEAEEDAHPDPARQVPNPESPSDPPPIEVEGGGPSDAPPVLELDWALLGEGQSVVARRSRTAAAGGPTARVSVPLHISDGPACLAELAAAGADINAGDLSGSTPLHKAVANDCLCAISLLLRAGADIEAADSYGDRALHRAADNGRVASGSLLVRRGAMIDAQNKVGEGALHRACANGETPFVSMLLQAGASVILADWRGWSPLHVTVDSGQQKTLIALVSFCKARRLPCALLETAGGEGAAAYPAHDSALHIGLRACRVLMLKWMLDQGFGPATLVVNSDGHTAADVLAALLPKMDKIGMKKAGKGAKSLLPVPAGGKEEKGVKKKKPPKNILHGITAEAGFARLAAEGVKGLLDLQKVMVREEKAAAALAAQKAKQEAADAKKRAEAEAKKAKAKGGKK